MIKVYCKTATTNAEQFDGSDEMVKKYKLIRPIARDPHYMLTTSEGIMSFDVGDWIATGVEGEHWAIKNDVFKKTYAELPVIPNYVAEYIDMAKNNETGLDNPNVIQAGIDVIEWDGGDTDLVTWIDKNGDVFARAWLGGYQVEADE